MQINITGHHVEVTEGLEQGVNKNLKKLTNHFPDIESINVILTVEKHEQVAEGIVHFLGQDFRSLNMPPHQCEAEFLQLNAGLAEMYPDIPLDSIEWTSVLGTCFHAVD